MGDIMLLSHLEYADGVCLLFHSVIDLSQMTLNLEKGFLI